MLESMTTVVLILHVLTAILMAWPFYVLVLANHRRALGPPIGGRLDDYFEDVIRRRAVPCFVFQGTALITGLALLWLRGYGLSGLIEVPMLGVKLLLLLVISATLAYVHFRVQPAIAKLLASARQGELSGEATRQVQALRGRRKRLASTCLFLVLTIAMLGVQASASLPLGVTLLLVVAIAGFTWRAYRGAPALGWV